MGLLAKIGTFGDVAAEDDDAVLSYFLETDAVDEIENGRVFAVIGRKGSGKTALTKYFSQPKKDYVSTSPSLRDYPWSLHAKRKNSGASDIESYVSSWRYLIAVKANSIVLEQKGSRQMTDSQRAAREFLNDNYGGIAPGLADILRPPKLMVTKRIIAPSVMGNSLGSLEIEKKDGTLSEKIDALTDSLLRNAVTLASQAAVSKICIHFDELDQGLSELTAERKSMLIGLILAIRSIKGQREGKIIFPAFYIRSDLWDELRFSDKNKISQTSATFLEWDNKTLLDLIEKRIKTKIGSDKSWGDIDDENLMRGSQSKWNHIVARTFLRPRDVIQFLNFGVKVAIKAYPDSDYFDNEDIQNAREPYSKYLRQELDDEIGPHWECWTDALQAFSEISTLTFSRDQFREAYDKRRSKKNHLDADEALEALYGFSVIGYRRGIGSGGSGWTFNYADPDAGWDSAAKSFKVHLGLKEIVRLREERS